MFSAEPSGNNRQRDIPGYLHMRRNFLLQLLPDMEEVYDNGSTSDEDERAIFIKEEDITCKVRKQEYEENEGEGEISETKEEENKIVISTKNTDIVINYR